MTNDLLYIWLIIVQLSKSKILKVYLIFDMSEYLI